MQYSSCASLLDRATAAARCGFIAARQEPRFHVTIIGALRIGDRQQESLAPVEKSGSKNIGAQERPESVQKTARERDPPPRCHDLLGTGAGIAIHARERVLDAIDRKVQKRLLEAPHATIAHHALVHDIVAEA